MKVTKFQHACLALEESGTIIVVDPGTFSHDFILPHHVDGIIITHNHPDHLDPTLVDQIIAANPKVTIIGHESITTGYSTLPTIPAKPGEHYQLGNLSLEFFGGQHAPIAEGIQTPPNLGVLVNNSFYYPGDSFTVPRAAETNELIPIATLALPISAPWLDFERTRSFLSEIKPTLAFPTHDGILSEDGKSLAEKMVGGFAHSQGTVYTRLDGASVNLT